jgi:V/A-type H+-transporting ATPase subunit D
MPERNLTATRITFLELGDERRLVREGHALLDEKRMLLAAEILGGLRRYATLRRQWLEALAGAREELAAAVRRHGLDGVTTHPGRPDAFGPVTLEERRLLGLHLAEARLEWREAEPEFPPAETSPEIESCARLFADLATQATEIAGLAASLRLMARDYVRTERRARALENVILPEIEGDIRFVESQLESIDQEESIRVREARARA